MKIFGRNLFWGNYFATIKNLRQKYFENFFRILFSINDFATIKKFRPKHFWWKFLVGTRFRGNVFATIKISTKISWWKFLVGTCFQGNDFAILKNFDKKISMKSFGRNLFSRKMFCDYKNVLPKNFRWKFLVGTCFRGNDFTTIKIFDKKIFDENFGRNLFSRKWFCDHRNFRPKSFWWKFLVGTCFGGNDFTTIKNSTIKFLMNIFGRNLFSRNYVATIKIFDQKMFDENFW